MPLALALGTGSAKLRRRARWTNGRSYAVVTPAVAASNAEWRPSPTAGNVRLINANRPKAGSGPKVKIMRHRVFRVAFAAVWLVATSVVPVSTPVLAQSTDAKPADQAPAKGQEPAKETQKADEYAEAAKALSGPAGNPECVWFGTRVVGLLWQDDLDTAFRHLDLYDRFGCPSGHIQESFRCLLHHSSSIDPKATDPKASLNGWANSCWLNPTQPVTAAPPATPAPAAAAPSAATNH
jgi:hypothetical protein